MAHIFPAEGVEQVWMASRGGGGMCFASLEATKERLRNYFDGFETAWEEGEPSADGKEWVQGHQGRRVSTLMRCTSSTRYGLSSVVQRWEDTGWRVWREQ